MQALFFNVLPKPGHMPHYFEHVARLKPVLARHRGLVFLDRYRPLDEPEALLSHQLWADEAAIAAWRADPEHRAAQAAGRRVHFQDYRIRVGEQLMHLTQGALPDLPELAGPDRLVVAAYGRAPVARPGMRGFESVNIPGRFISLLAADTVAAALGAAVLAQAAGADDVRVFRIVRDYTLADRAEAPR
jgi:heme-degrading monooxygenase HmoA